MSRIKVRNTGRIEDDETVREALKERHADDIWLVTCPYCGIPSYWNQGSHAECRECGRDISNETDDAFTLADFWDYAPYPCDERPAPQETLPPTKEEK